LELAGLRADAVLAMEQFGMSERRACRLVELDRSRYRYEPRADHNAELREELVKLARQKPRYGYRRLHVLLSKRGHLASAQRIYRLYREERLMVRRLGRKRLVRPANEDRRAYDLRASFASRANACHASGLTIAQLLGHATSTQILPTYVKPLDENTKAVIEALDIARNSQSAKSGSIQ
jgi:hypothetical protein